MDKDKIQKFYDILSSVKYTKDKKEDHLSGVIGGEIYTISTSTDEFYVVVYGKRGIRYNGVSYNVDRDISSDLFFLLTNKTREMFDK